MQEMLKDDPVIRMIQETGSLFPSIQKIVLFGSRARGDCKPSSDYDLCVYATDKEGIRHFVRTYS